MTRAVSGVAVWFRERPINRNFASLFYGQAISVLGTVAFNTTVALWVGAVLTKGRPWSPAALSGVLACAAAATLIVSPLVGVLIDRWDRRRAMLGADIARAVLCALLAGVALLPSQAASLALRLTLIYLFIFGINAVDQIFGLARMAVIAQVLDSDAERATGVGMEQATSNVSSIVAPPLAAPLLLAYGAEWAFLINAASYLISFVCIRAIDIPPHVPPSATGDGENASYRRQFVDGLRAFAGNRALLSMAGIAFISQSGIGALTALDLYFLTDNLDQPTKLYGFMAMSFGVGGILGALLAGRLVKHFGARASTWMALVGSGLIIIVYARQTALVPALILLAASGVSLAVLSTSVVPLLLRATPDEYFGRVFAVFNPILQLGWFSSIALAGWLASTAMLHFRTDVFGLTIGRVDTIFTASGTLILIAGLCAIALLPRLGEEAVTPER